MKMKTDLENRFIQVKRNTFLISLTGFRMITPHFWSYYTKNLVFMRFYIVILSLFRPFINNMAEKIPAKTFPALKAEDLNLAQRNLTGVMHLM